MKPHAPLTCNIHPPPPPLRPPPKRSLPAASCPPLSFLRRFASPLHLRSRPSRNVQFPEAVRFDGPFIGSEAEEEGTEIEVETVVTRTLPPAVTLERGLQCIKEAVEELKLNPPQSRRGVLRFQVAVPPGPKALSWFCCQPESSGVFPTFFLSNENEESLSFKSLSVNQTRGVFGIGTSLYFSHSATGSVKRYLSSDSSLTTSYGFMDANFDMELSSLKHETGSFYLVVPEIELHEHEDISALSATLAWDEILHFPFRHAIHSLESSLFQAASHFWPSSEWYHFGSKYFALRKIGLLKHDFVKLVSVKAPMWADKEHNHDRMEPLEDVQDIGHSFQHCTNINAVWASLLVEECCRLGLTYFCIAPGSRSSPLAIAASAHSHTTCVACFDERSLAFHAIGYARGAQKPAVVITTSGTAVSNLLPAVVEASQDLLPLLLLTADRPPELQDVGANQAINQVNHFSSFVRFFFNLPAPSDIIPARMVLTTLDSAVYRAMSSPSGPVHVNCPFREPLDDSPYQWMPSCLRGLDFWMSSAQPFTRYFQLQNLLGSSFPNWVQFKEVFKDIEDARQGLLLLGSIHTEDEIWAALLLAKHLNWPVASDILSGLRLRKILSFLPEANGNILFIDHLDHALLSASVRALFQLDVVIQLGSRMTSKRISQMLEESCPRTYLLIDNHPYRHDPSHLVTHRLQCSIAQFVDSLMSTTISCKSSPWCHDLRTIESMVTIDVSSRVNAESSMSEPFVVHVASKSLTAGSALFVGNSMAIRDADMYGCSWKNVAHSVADVLLYPGIPFLPVRVAGNRGASGIDGLISTAVGFAVGSNKRVLCIVGDVSFLHDTNGLAILNQRMLRKPMTIIVINNHGGAIFSFLPIADRTDARILDQYFYTSHSTSIQKLCHAHGVKHLPVKTKSELHDALLASQHEMTDFVIEVESNIDSNSKFHSALRKSACQIANDACGALSRLSLLPSCMIHRMEYSLYRIQLSAPSTLSFCGRDSYGFHKEGYVLSLFLEDGRLGYGEVAPLYKESILDVEQQLRFLLHVLKGTTIPLAILLLNGSFASWILNSLGLPEHTVHPSVLCGLEMAILNAVGTRDRSSFLGIVKPRNMDDDPGEDTSSSVTICALLDSGGTPDEAAHLACLLVNEGFTAIKLKVARREDPVQDAAVVKEVRKKIGMHIELRVDANRNWSYEEAMIFGSLVKDCDLRYIEEPVRDEDDILKYHEESGLPVALDETIDSVQGNPFNLLEKYAHPGIVALVIKPSVVGGFERAALIAKWAHCHRKLAVLSSAFESSLGLSNYILFSHYLDLQNAAVVELLNRGQQVAHGLGTYRWLLQDVAPMSLRIRKDPCTGFMGASVAEATQLLQNFHVNEDVICTNFKGEEVHSYHITGNTEDFSCSLKVHEVGGAHDIVVVFLHGFLGSGDEWIPIMKAVSGSAKCISIDLPGHGDSKVKANATEVSGPGATWSVENVADLLSTLIRDITPGKITLVGYSMGARIALHLALRLSDKVNGAIIISGSPGLKDSMARKVRRARDDSKAKNLKAYGIDRFLEDWYAGELWKSLRNHPHFKKVVASRLLQDDIHNLAEVLSGLSIGRQLSLWEDLKHCTLPLLFIVGKEDIKFKSIAQAMLREIDQSGKREDNSKNSIHQIIEVPESGHAVHLENPLAVIKALGQFLPSLR